MDKTDRSNAKLEKEEKDNHEQDHDAVEFDVVEQRNAEEWGYHAKLCIYHHGFLTEVLRECRIGEAEDKVHKVYDLNGQYYWDRKAAFLVKL